MDTKELVETLKIAASKYQDNIALCMLLQMAFKKIEELSK